MSTNNNDGDCCFGSGCGPLVTGGNTNRRFRECADPSQRVDLRGLCHHDQFFLNTEQTATAYCPCGSQGSSVMVTVPAGTVASTLSVQDADTQAYLLAFETAEAELVCEGVYFNTPQTAYVQCEFGEVQEYTTPAGMFSSTVSQEEANALAYAYALEQATEQCEQDGLFTVSGDPLYTLDGNPLVPVP